MGLIEKIFRRSSDASKDASDLYQMLMKQSRNPIFYGTSKVPDSYDGRIEFLTLHVSAVMNALQGHGETGKRLSQALFDVMVDDFDVALREEGLTDSGVKRRIKPMIAFFYARLKDYSKSFSSTEQLETALKNGALKDSDGTFLQSIGHYIYSLRKSLSNKDLGTLAKGDFEFPEFQE